MSRGYLYFPGCSLKSQGVAYEKSLVSLFRLLDLPLQELDDWNCCGATSYMALDERAAFTLSARNLAIAKQSGGQDVVAPCAACYLVLRKTQDYVAKYPAIGKQVHESLANAGLGSCEGVKVRHPLEVLYNDVTPKAIKSKVVRKWTGGKIACYYGCQAVRPYDEVDKPHNPMRMDELMQAAGIPTVDYALKTKCCGGSLTGTVHEVGVQLNRILLQEATRKGAEALVTICPLCQFNLDAYQCEMNGEFDMPVLYFSQLLAWSLGADMKDLALNKSIAGGSRLKRWLTAEKEELVHA